MTRLRIGAKLLRCCIFGLVVSLVGSGVGGESSEEISEAPHYVPDGGDSVADYSSNEEGLYGGQDLTVFGQSQAGETEGSVSVDGYGSLGDWGGGGSSSFGGPYYDQFAFEFEQREKLVCQEKFCSRALHGRRSSKLFRSYVESVLKGYISDLKLRSWFFRMWSGSTVLTSPVLYIGPRLEFREVYKLARKNYQKLKDSAVVVLLKVMTKKVSRELALEEEEEASGSSSLERSEGSFPDGGEERGGGGGGSADWSGGEASYSTSQAVKSLCVKLRGLSKHKRSDNGRSYLLVVEAHGITDRLVFSRLMSGLIQTSCWNRANMDKSRVIIPVIVGDFKHKSEGGILSDVYNPSTGPGKSSSKSLKPPEPSSGLEISASGPESVGGIRQEDPADFGAEYSALFVKWLKRCNESKIIYERYETGGSSPGLFGKLLTQYLVYAVNDKVVGREISERGKRDQGYRHFMSEYPKNCHGSWEELLLLVEREYRDRSISFKVVLIGTILESLHVANKTLFKDEGEGQTAERRGSERKEESGLNSRVDKDPEVCELYSMLSARDESPVQRQQAGLMEDLLARLGDLPDNRRSRLAFKRHLSGLKMERELGAQVLELFEAVDHVQRSLHLIRVMYITNLELGLTLNPLEVLISVCRNAKLIPAEGYSQGRAAAGARGRKTPRTDLSDATGKEDLEEAVSAGKDGADLDGEGDAMEECNPFVYLSEEVLSEEYEGDVMEFVQKSSIRLVLVLLRLGQYNVRILSLHVSNLVIKVERLLLGGLLLDAQKVPSMVLLLAEKVLTFPFGTLSTFPYLREVSETRAVSLLRPFVPLFPSYTLLGLYGDSLELWDRRLLGRALVMEICMLYYDPKSLLEPEFAHLCAATWEDPNKYFKGISQANSKCKKLSSSGQEKSQREPREKQGALLAEAGAVTSPTIFILCDLLDKLESGPESRGCQDGSFFPEVRESYHLSRQFEDQCDKIKSYSIQQSGNLYNELVKLYKK